MELTPNFDIPIPSDPMNQRQVRAEALAIDALLLARSPKLGITINSMEPPYNVKGNGTDDDTTALNLALYDAAHSATGSGHVLFSGTPKITDSLLAGRDDTFTGVSLGSLNGLIGSSLIWAGATDGVMLKIIKGRFNHIHDIFFQNSVGRNSTVAILAAGPGIDLQTAHTHLERCDIRGFGVGFQSGDPATNSASDEGYFSKVDFEDCGKGFLANSNFNSVKFHFDACTFATSDYGIYSVTGSSISLDGCNGGSNAICDLYVDGGGVVLTIVGWDGEGSKQFLKTANGAIALVVGAQLRAYQLGLARDDDQYIIDPGGPVELYGVFHGGNFRHLLFTANASTDVLTRVAHGLKNGDEVSVSNTGGGLPAPLAASTYYFVRDVTADTFKLATTLGGTAINITSTGSGSNYIDPKLGPHLVHATGYPILIRDSKTCDSHPVYIHPSSGISGGTNYDIKNVDLIDATTNQPYSSAPNGQWVIIYPYRVPFFTQGGTDAS